MDERRRTPEQRLGDAAEERVAEHLQALRVDRPRPERADGPLRARPRGRSTPARRRALVVVEVRWRAGRRIRPARGDRRPPQARRAFEPVRTACSIAGPCRTARRCRGCRCASTSWSWNRTAGCATTARRSDRLRGPASEQPVLHSRPARGSARANHPPAPQARSTHADRSDRDGAGQATMASRPPATRSAEERTEQEVAHRAVRFDAPAARGRRPLRPPDPPLEPQDAPVHLRGAQRDPHHRPRPDRPAPGRRPRVRPRDRRPRRAASCSSAPRSRPRSRSPQEATRAGQPYVNKRWLGGMLTNFVTIKKRIGLLEQLEARQQAGDFERHDQEGSRQADRGDEQAPGARSAACAR